MYIANVYISMYTHCMHNQSKPVFQHFLTKKGDEGKCTISSSSFLHHSALDFDIVSMAERILRFTTMLTTTIETMTSVYRFIMDLLENFLLL